MRIRFGTMALAGALAALMLNVAPAAADGSPVFHVGDSARKQVVLVYHPDDICGPRAGWTQVVITFHWSYTQISDDAFNFVWVETGTYHTDFDDPNTPSYDGQFTYAEHATATIGDTNIHTFQAHDFPGSITIHERFQFVQVGARIVLDGYDLRVDGCP